VRELLKLSYHIGGRITGKIALTGMVIGLCCIGAPDVSHALTNPVLPDSVSVMYRVFVEQLTDELEPEEAAEIVERIELLRINPLPINSATQTDLRRLEILSGTDIGNILAAREERGPFRSAADLLGIPGVDHDTMLLLMNFVSFDVPGRHRRRAVTGFAYRTFLGAELQERRGFAEGRYVGSPLTTSQRLLIESNDAGLSGGFLTHKSAGERSLTEHISGYLHARLFGGRLDIVAGDYRLRSGQGILFGSGFGISKGGNPTGGIAGRSYGVRTAVSRSSHYIFRGTAVSVKLGTASLDILYARTPRTATVYGDGTVRAITTYPVYRTEADLARKNTLTEKMYGAHLRLAPSRGASAGLAWYALGYDRVFVTDLGTRFSGDRMHHAAIDWMQPFRWGYVFGEAAAAFPVSAIALLSGTWIRLYEGVELAGLLRYYPARYTSMYGFSFGERRGSPEDERGFYLGVRVRPRARFFIEGYGDVFTFTNEGRSPAFPVNGSDLLLRITYPLPGRASIEGRYRRRIRDVPFVDDVSGIREQIVTIRRQHNLRVTLLSNPHSRVRLRTRFEHVNVAYPGPGETESGLYMAADLQWALRANLRIDARFLLYDTDSYDSRLYSMEYDVPGQLRTILLSGQGNVQSLGVRYTVGNTISVYAKYAESFRNDGESFGSGWQEVRGPLLNLWMLQFDLRM
jgi:hypothetical protein